MSSRDAWIAVAAAAAVTQLLRLVPVGMIRWGGDQVPPRLARALECAGLATIGSLIASAVWAPASEGGVVGLDMALKIVALGLAFGLYLWTRRGILCLVLAYAVYVLLTLALRPGFAP